MEVGQSDKQASKQTSYRTTPDGQMLHGACRLRPLRRNGKAGHARARLCLPLTVAPARHVPTARPASPDCTVRAHRLGVVSAKGRERCCAPLVVHIRAQAGETILVRAAFKAMPEVGSPTWIRQDLITVLPNRNATVAALRWPSSPHPRSRRRC